MKTILMNMVRIFDGNKVLVLDKIKKEGWEGLTFPGGKVEPYERFDDAAIREVKEETNLTIKDLEFNGFIQWNDEFEGLNLVGLLYTAYGYEGELISENREGKLFFEDYETFKKMPGHSKSMDAILKIYEGEKKEIVRDYKGSELIRER